MSHHEQHEQRIRALEESVATIKCIVFALIFWLTAFAAGFSWSADAQLAVADRQQFPTEYWPNLYYVSTERLPEAAREPTATALAFMVASSTQQPIVERCSPTAVTATLWRLDVAHLGWPLDAWRELVARYPYAVSRNSLLLRADWLLLQLADQEQGGAYYDLLFPGATTRDEALALLAVDPDKRYRFGVIEGQSGVSVVGTRWIESRPKARGYAWLTRDVEELVAAKDMLESPDGSFKHDGEEIIIGMRKFSLATGEQGALQAYFLANGQGELVDKAPVTLVVDGTEFRGLPEIRNPGSCIQCHDGGLNPVSESLLRGYIESGVDAFAKDADGLEAFHFADLRTDIDRANEDFRRGVRLVTGQESEVVARKFKQSVLAYDRPLDLGGAAIELHEEPGELSRALAWASAGGHPLPARLAGLAHGQTVPRDAWEEHYLKAVAIMAAWRSRG